MSLYYNRETDSYCMDPRTSEEKDREYVEHMMQEPRYSNHLDKLNLMLTLIEESMDPKKTKHEKNKIEAQIDFLDWEIELDLCCDRGNQEYPDKIRHIMQECKFRVTKHLDRISAAHRKEPMCNRIKKLIEQFADEKKVGFEHADKLITDLLMKATFDVLDRKDPDKSVKDLLKVMVVNFPELKDPESMYETCGLYTKLQFSNNWGCDALISESTLSNIDKIRTRENPCLDNRDYEEVLSVCIHLLVSKIFPTEKTEILNNHELRRAIWDYSNLCHFLGEDEM